MNGRSSTKRLGSVYGVTTPCVEFEIGGERLIGQQADFRTSSLNGATLGVSKQQAPKAPALLLRRDRDVLDPQMIGSQNRLDETGKHAVDDEKINRVLGDRPLIVCLHRERLPPDQRHPFGVGRARQDANARGVRKNRGPDFDVGSERDHRLDYYQG